MVLAASLVGILLIIGALVVWQHATKGLEEITYGIEDAVEFVTARLDHTALGQDGVRRILEYQLFYLQGLAQEDRRHPVDSVAGPYGPAVEYVADQIKTRHGREYPGTMIEEVLSLGAEYLSSIGAVGEPVREDEL